ncbi:MAG TPA: S8 family serine peptidase [Candidatus Polarisedimenticolaceae bacterium]|nr:S8 family serine peptidase [Candidatus Polarisedimenticolaceae bacterium]
MRLPALVLVAALVAAAALAAEPADVKIAPWLSSRLAGGAQDGLLVLFDDDAGLQRTLHGARGSAGVYAALTERAHATQASLRAALTADGIPFRPLYLVNGLALRGDLALARRIAARPEVVRIVGDPKVQGIESSLFSPAPSAIDTIEWGVSRVNADHVWTLDGKRGEGIVVASADTGVEWTHPAIQGKYRGWNGTTASHDFNWFDAIDATTTAPLDDNNHGTHTTGTMVGDDGAGNQIGVAPGAKWIACRNMDHGVGQPSTYIACNQFFLAPFPHGGDPETDGDPSLSPDIVNNSWSCPTSEGCDAFVLESSFAALRAAGILAVAAAQNSGPGCSTVTDPPGIYDEALVAGASDINNALAGFSSRGPVTTDGSGRMRPDVAAPGVSVRSSIRGGTYASFSGTSMASPHTAGSAALLWSAKPQVRGLIGITKCLLSRSTTTVLTLSSPQTCGGTTAADRPNNFWGWGLVDAYNAIHFGPDSDGDGIADVCDCRPADSGVYDTPSDVTRLEFNASKTLLSWDDQSRQAGNATVYDVVRGDLQTLRATGTIADALCHGPAGTATSLGDPSIPAVDAGFYYVVRARNACGDGGWGASSSGPRTHATCP